MDYIAVFMSGEGSDTEFAAVYVPAEAIRWVSEYPQNIYAQRRTLTTGTGTVVNPRDGTEWTLRINPEVLWPRTIRRQEQVSRDVYEVTDPRIDKFSDSPFWLAMQRARDTKQVGFAQW